MLGASAHAAEASEQRQAAAKDEAAAEPVAQSGGSDDAGGEGDAVRGDRPLQRGNANVQVAMHARQRGDHDHRIKYDHEVDGRGQRDHPAEGSTRCRFACHL